jgi:hypothetical protein
MLELAGDMYLHPAKAPITFRGFNSGYWNDKAILTVYCGIESCNHKLHEVYFELNDKKTLFLILNTFTSHYVENLWKM